jgi:DNA-binding XRE family transcriptional regulator
MLYYYNMTSRKPEPTIHNRIAVLRVERGVTRQQLADALDINVQTVGYLERGDYNPSLALAFAIAAWFELPIDACSARRRSPDVPAAVRPPDPRTGADDATRPHGPMDGLPIPSDDPPDRGGRRALAYPPVLAAWYGLGSSAPPLIWLAGGRDPGRAAGRRRGCGREQPRPAAECWTSGDRRARRAYRGRLFVTGTMLVLVLGIADILDPVVALSFDTLQPFFWATVHYGSRCRPRPWPGAARSPPEESGAASSRGSAPGQSRRSLPRWKLPVARASSSVPLSRRGPAQRGSAVAAGPLTVTAVLPWWSRTPCRPRGPPRERRVQRPRASAVFASHGGQASDCDDANRRSATVGSSAWWPGATAASVHPVGWIMEALAERSRDARQPCPSALA